MRGGKEMNEVLFYGGIIGLGCTLVLAVIVGIVYLRAKRRLRRQLEEEYGPRRT